MMIVNKKYKLNKEWLDLMLENKNNTNLTFNLSDNDTRILLTYIEVLQQENARLKEIENKLIFIKNRAKQGMSQENINKCAIKLINSYLKEN